MALRTSDTEGDKKNPSQAGYEKLVSGKQADELHDRVYGDDVRRGVAEAEAAASGAPGVNGRDLKDSEEKGTWDNGVEGKPEDKKKGGFFGFVRSKKGATTMVTTGLVGGGIMTTIFFGGLLAPITFFQNITDDLNDQLAALDNRSSYIFRHKFSNPATKGCTVLSIRCKMVTMSDKELARYRRVGIEITGNKNVFGRTVPQTAVYKGESMGPEGFYQRYQSDQTLRRDVRRANNMKILGLSDSRFVNWTLKRFGISRKAPELRGKHEDRVKQLMNRARVTNVTDIRFALIEEGEEAGKFRLEGDTNPEVTYTPEEVEIMRDSIDKVRGSPSPSRLKTVGISALSIQGGYDLACTVVNRIGMASAAAKITNSVQMAQYAMPFSSLAAKVQAGDSSPEDSAALGDAITGADQRSVIVDINKSVKEASSDGSMKLENTSVDNPNYGKSAMDSDLYKLSAYGDLPAPSFDRLAYSMGYSQNMVLKNLSMGADVLGFLVNIGSDGSVCKVVQNWFVRGAGLVVGIVLGIFSGGSSLAISATLAVAIGAVLIAMDSILNSMLDQSLFSEDMDKDPIGSASGIWGGMSAIQGEAAKSRGMMPGNSDQILAYKSLQDESLQEYIAIESENVELFDATNPRSFVGSIINGLSQYIKPSAKINSSFSSIYSVVLGSLGKAVGAGKVSAQSFNPERYKQCDDEEYKKVGIDADVQCNVRYVMPNEDLSIDSMEALEFMESGGYIEADSTTGVPAGYRPPEAAESQGFAMDMLNGFVGSLYVDRYSGMTDKQKDYAQYLDFCVYRSMPFGETYEESGAFGDASANYKNGKNCMNTTDKKYSYFRVYTMDVSVIEALGEETENLFGSDSDGGNISLPSGTAIELAKKIIASGNVTDGTRQGQIKRVSNGQSPIPGSGLSVDTKVLALIAGSAEAGNKFRVSSMARNYIPPGGSTTSRHLSGRAFDVAGSINGVVVNYNTHSSVIQEFINQMASVMPNNCEIGVPNRQYVNETKKVAPNGCSVFVDIGTGAHLHFGVP